MYHLIQTHMKQFSIFAFILLFVCGCNTTSSPLQDKMDKSMKTSVSLRNDTTGIWETAGWWNSASLLTTLIRYSEVTGSKEYFTVIDDVFEKARQYELGTDETGTTHYRTNFINDYYDDEGWWALAFIEADRVTKQRKYLQMAETIFEDMTTGWSDECNGGIYWRKNPWRYKNSIANNLFSLTAIRLYKATGQQKFKDWFEKSVAWYRQSGMINMDIYQIEDGLEKNCQPNKDKHFTYNQGVAIAVLTEMYEQSNDKQYLDLAEKIAQATITTQLVTEDGILREMRPSIDKSKDGVQFKGIFIRHLAYLYKVTQNPMYKDFIVKNAESIITKNYDADSKSFGHYWQGPFTEPSAAANSCALDCVIEAYDLTKAKEEVLK